ncbi:Helix-turn-helix domain-containing protein [Actinopolyspora xinjiangensis]|uniref:Helix-turn-helix domain-containing protein n=1 Tax=Actinopolyspora xinjiangensis TaxID=405564 RepID=A0A1H0VYE8_9ACTN|nr:helix-turn-helix transcriptional regulator [Actinopolyspora xinjiangensis]SDP83245.1 Helix-turn-helix domain-containing protein [Actinopolyspora xinjiangensis]
MGTSEPTMHRIQLGMELEQLRTQAGREREEVAERLGWYPTKVGKVETGAATLSAAEVEVLLGYFEADETTAERVRQLGKEARRRGSYGKVSDWARSYVGMEAGASEILLFAEELIPGLLQTEDYARAVAEASVVTKRTDIDQLVKRRVERREKLYSAAPPRLSVVLGEAALRRRIGGAEVMHEQLDLLRELAELQHVTLQVLPFSTGSHASLGTSFTILRLHNNRKHTVYVEDITSADYLDRPHHLETYNLVYERLRMDALGLHESQSVLRQTMNDLGAGG